MPVERLRRVTFAHLLPSGGYAMGAVDVDVDAAAATVSLVRALLRYGFPLTSARPAAFATTAASRAADNTQGFRCERLPTGDWEPHSFGRVLDLNPVENPTVSAGAAADPAADPAAVDPPAGEPFTDRSSLRPGMLSRHGPVSLALAASGFVWSGAERGSRTYGVLRLAAPPDGIQAAVEPVGVGDVTFSYRSGCPVTPAALRRVTLNYWGFDAAAHRGELVLAAGSVAAVLTAMTRAYAVRFPLRRLIRVDAFGGSDLASMAADNTSAFNCRKVTGNPYRISQHSWGNAIDINPLENPYVTSARIYPDAARVFLRRAPAKPGMITPHGAVMSAFTRLHWLWGARWSLPDWQHFSSNGG